MYALAVEYGPGPAALPPLALRWAYRDLLACQPGYRRRLDLRGGGGERIVEIFLFVSVEAAQATLDGAMRAAFVAAHPACRDTTRALLVRAGDALGTPAVILRRSRPASANGGQVCWRDTLARDEGTAALW